MEYLNIKQIIIEKNKAMMIPTGLQMNSIFATYIEIRLNTQ